MNPPRVPTPQTKVYQLQDQGLGLGWLAGITGTGVETISEMTALCCGVAGVGAGWFWAVMNDSIRVVSLATSSLRSRFSCSKWSILRWPLAWVSYWVSLSDTKTKNNEISGRRARRQETCYSNDARNAMFLF